MSRATTVTKLPLVEWAKIMGINPLHFCGVQITATQRTTVGGDAWPQYDWQDNDRVSREQVARQIRSAEDDIEEYLGYRLLPSWDKDEWQPTIRPYHPETENLNDRDIRGRGQQVRLNYGHMISGGIRSKEVIVAASPIVYSSTMLPVAYEETATVTVATSVTDPQEIHVYLAGKSGDDASEIRPINVAIAASIATITFRRELVVVEAAYETLDIGEGFAVEGTTDANFETTVDVYRVYNDPQTQGTLLWEPVSRVTDGEAAAYDVQTAALWLRGSPVDPAVIYAPATWDATTGEFSYAAYQIGRQPDLVRLWYYGGYEDQREATPRITMDRDMARTVASMAAARLDRDDCGGADISRYRQDLAIAEYQGDNVSLPGHVLNNPFGTRRGEVEAFQKLRKQAKGQSALA